MANPQRSPSPFRPRFSLRAVAILVTLVCLYFGVWELTKRAANRMHSSRKYDLDEGVLAASSPMPLVLSTKEIGFRQWLFSSSKPAMSGPPQDGPRCYYLWLFGPTIKLPFEAEW